MNRYAPLALAPLLILGACTKDNPTDTTRITGGTVPAAAPSPTANDNKDNTATNSRDQPGGAMTPIDQGTGAADLETTQEIRKAVLADESLSFDAKNAKIITKDGVVYLRGPVKDEGERATIERRARQIANTDSIVNQLDVEQK
jgi:hyperosmotically inducible protein